MKLKILTPETLYYEGVTDSITFPGEMGSFQVMNNHAPILSSLNKGVLSFMVNGEKRQIEISNGLMELHNNEVTVCIDEIYNQ